ncbi:MAG TPA: glycosyltransferase family 2 protein [Chthoniobacterales bacterium]|nr:glycosyltransferase family 2 protein [Chthoniobacterales bacterium]
MQRPLFQTIRSDFARLIARKFAPARLLLVGNEAGQITDQRSEDEIESSICPGITELDALRQDGSAPQFDLAIWFYPLEIGSAEDQPILDRLTALVDNLVLIPGAGADVAKRRPPLVMHLASRGFFPDYESDIVDIEPGAIRLSRQKAESVDVLLPAVEIGFARINAQLRRVRRTLRTRMSELEAADRHIARLEEKVLKLKQAKRDLKQLKAEKHALRKSPERKIGQVILAPYRLPQKLIREVRKHLGGPVAPRSPTPSPSEYQKWLQSRRASAKELAAARAQARAFSYCPLISIITPVFNTPRNWLGEAIDSVVHQAYENWELLLIDDGSTLVETVDFLATVERHDPRIVLVKRDSTGGISAASNSGLERARGEWVGLLDHDDILEPDALFEVVKYLQTNPETDLIFSDEDKITEEGLAAPQFKPDWSPDFLLSYNYLCHFTTVRREIIEKAGRFRPEFDGAQDYDLFLRVSELTTRIHHLPRILYHWRRSETSTSDNIRRKPQALEAGRHAIESHLERRGERGHVAVDWQTHAYWVKRELRETKRIAIIIATRDRIDLLSRCISSITSKTSYPNYEIIVVDNESTSDEAREYFRNCEHRVLPFNGPFNFSALNNLAVEQTTSPWLLFLNNDVEAIDNEWLTVMAEHVQRPEVGAVGARLLYPNDTVQHAGVVLGVGGIAEHAFRHFPADAPGVSRQLQVTRNYSSVTGACLLTRRDVFEEVGGFDEERLPVTFNDVDLCLKMRRAGYLIVYTPFARLYHHESASRRRSVEALETEVMRERWPDLLERDPYYNPNLSRERADFSLGK